MAEYVGASHPSKLRITDMRVAVIDGAPKRYVLIKLFTNQGVVGFGEVRDAASATYALMLKSRLLGENPCNVEKLFRRIRQFASHSRFGGGVSGVEVALWDLVGKAYGIPVYQLLGGKYRDKIRIYCDTDVEAHAGPDQLGDALRARIEAGFTMLKMDLGIEFLVNLPGTMNAPSDLLSDLRRLGEGGVHHQSGSISDVGLQRDQYELRNRPHPFTGTHVTERGIDSLEQWVSAAREAVGPEVPLAIDHLGHIPVEDVARIAGRLEPYGLLWIEDPVPWQYVNHYSWLRRMTSTPICTGEDIYLAENFRPLLEAGAVSVIHPDVLTVGGIRQTKAVGDLAAKYGVPMAIHMAESPIACMAAVHAAAATESFLALEYHSVEVPWWDDLVEGPSKPIVDHGFIKVPDAPGLGIEKLNDELIERHVARSAEAPWSSTEQWDNEYSNDRLWS